MECILRTIDLLMGQPIYLGYFEKARNIIYEDIICHLLEINNDDRINY
jgi:hypothetical protein